MRFPFFSWHVILVGYYSVEQENSRIKILKYPKTVDFSKKIVEYK